MPAQKRRNKRDVPFTHDEKRIAGVSWTQFWTNIYTDILLNWSKKYNCKMISFNRLHGLSVAMSIGGYDHACDWLNYKGICMTHRTVKVVKMDLFTN